MDSQIALSRDGIFWSWPERRAVHTVGQPGDGDQCSAHPWRNGLVELTDGRWAVVYSGNSPRHNVHEKGQGPDVSGTETDADRLYVVAATSFLRHRIRSRGPIYRSNHLSSYERVEDELSLRAERLDHYGPSAQVVGRLTRSGSD